MRKKAIAFLSVLIVGLMMVPGGVSAGTMSIAVDDRESDEGIGNIDWDRCEFTTSWPDGTPIAQAGFFDILSFSLSLKAKTYTFVMVVAADFPEVGSELGTGFKAVEWLMWIDPEPWNMKYNNIMSLYAIKLVYYQEGYMAFIQDYATGEILANLPFAVDGSKMQVRFSAALIGNLESFWFMPCTVVRWSIAGYWDLDTTDPGAVEGQVWWDIPWPPQ